MLGSIFNNVFIDFGPPRDPGGPMGPPLGGIGSLVLGGISVAGTGWALGASK